MSDNTIRYMAGNGNDAICIVASFSEVTDSRFVMAVGTPRSSNFPGTLEAAYQSFEAPKLEVQFGYMSPEEKEILDKERKALKDICADFIKETQRKKPGCEMKMIDSYLFGVEMTPPPIKSGILSVFSRKEEPVLQQLESKIHDYIAAKREEAAQRLAQRLALVDPGNVLPEFAGIMQVQIEGQKVTLRPDFKGLGLRDQIAAAYNFVKYIDPLLERRPVIERGKVEPLPELLSFLEIREIPTDGKGNATSVENVGIDITLPKDVSPRALLQDLRKQLTYVRVHFLEQKQAEKEAVKSPKTPPAKLYDKGAEEKFRKEIGNFLKGKGHPEVDRVDALVELLEKHGIEIPFIKKPGENRGDGGTSTKGFQR